MKLISQVIKMSSWNFNASQHEFNKLIKEKNIDSYFGRVGLVYLKHTANFLSDSACVLSFIQSFIEDIYIAPLRVGLLRSAPNPARPNNVVLSC